MDLGLKGKVAMVARASRAWGSPSQKVLPPKGLLVSMSSRNEQAITASAAKIGAESGVEPLAQSLDVRSGESIQAWFDATVAKFGGVDLLFVNAGGPPAGTVLSFDDAAWQGAFELLVLSAVRMVRLCAPSMKQRGGGRHRGLHVVGGEGANSQPALSNVIRSSVSALSKTLTSWPPTTSA